MRVRVKARDREFEFEARAGERILHAGLRAGYQLPYECATGTCGKCKAGIADGRVEDAWPEAPGRRFIEPGQPQVLMCQCSALGELDIDVPKPVPSTGAGEPIATMFDGVLKDPRALAHGVLGFSVELNQSCSFHAGQFMLLRPAGVSGYRAYSMCNYADARRLDFVIKQKRMGRFSEWLFGTDRAGEALQLFGPLGKATFDPSLSRNILCIAGGSGIAGMMSILACADAARHFEHHQGWVFFGVRTLADSFFLSELSKLAVRWGGRLTVTVALSDEAVPASAVAVWPELLFEHGLVHEVARRAMSGRYANLRAYVAGPPPAVESAMRVLLAEGKLRPGDICYDKFN
ncbi:MAG: 2Fe-2S iron-sulfur cluster binding domain-containing protein [Betaproteobacteria bacterium]|nr:2Fe-2S iron-sulfur cluster binding domain-containing protein [Betaproteobacteria bacterium]